MEEHSARRAACQSVTVIVGSPAPTCAVVWGTSAKAASQVARADAMASVADVHGEATTLVPR
ncbi:hypothetical protein G7085_12380 [Tessaracoccus sp. HDW20]|uniref:hypothetical protein n=1 Tax=Tessaracoccus coleopterorum TaxID=2714950 RepID=UPI0018D48A98|nr:hypothetical protein [Tessaracoccus coleopterorum]NHB85145.1 hypothetical protein [Tessaracoccus coleopterorum]